MEIQCYKCGHKWFYRGQSKHYICCPDCHNKISLRKLAKKTTYYKGKNYILQGQKLHTTPEKMQELHTTKEKDFKLIENKHGDKLMAFDDGLKVIIPRAPILFKMLENYPKGLS